MKKSTLIGIIIGVQFLNFNICKSQTSAFDLSIESIEIPNLIGVQSYSWGQSDGKWLIVGGRIDGLHKSMGMGMMGAPFPSSSNNNELIVIDPLTFQKWTKSISSLPVDIREQISSTNTQYFQEGNFLYVLGGYGYKSSISSHITFNKLTAIDVPNVINAVINGTSILTYFRQITDLEFQVTGGQLEKIYDTYYLVGGHNFEGTYMNMGGMGMFTQTYTNQIRKFKINDTGSSIQINHIETITDSTNLHRRDYNLVPQTLPNHQEGLTIFSGVFQYTSDIPYLNCVNIDSSNHYVNESFAQYYNHYQCAHLPIYSYQDNEMHTVFFGGIAQYYDNSGTLTQDNNVPFVKTIARVTRTSDGGMNEYKLPVELPDYLGAGSEFIPNLNAPYSENGILNLDDITADTTLVGYIFGGIKSPSPNVFNTGMMGNNGTIAYNKIFKVYLIKSQIIAANHELNKQSSNKLNLQIYPNPNKGFINVDFHITKETPITILINDTNGELIKEYKYSHPCMGINHYTFALQELGNAGIYYITLKSSSESSTQKIILSGIE